jgi:hypothetical protein
MITGWYREKLPNLVESPLARREPQIEPAPEIEIAAAPVDVAPPADGADIGKLDAALPGEAQEAAKPATPMAEEEVKHV